MSDEVLDLLTELFSVVDSYSSFEWDSRLFNVFCKLEILLKTEISCREAYDSKPYSEEF